MQRTRFVSKLRDSVGDGRSMRSSKTRANPASWARTRSFSRALLGESIRRVDPDPATFPVGIDHQHTYELQHTPLSLYYV
jgi:hypothetical protein